MDNRPVLVSGASGFVGRHLLTRLVAAGRHVVALHRRPVDETLRMTFGAAVTWRAADISRDDLSGIVPGVGSVFHLAAFVTNSESAADAAAMMRINCGGSERLAIASRDADASRFILVSSIAAGEVAASPDVDEVTGVPRSSYGKSKLAAEAAVLALGSAQFSVTVLRPTALFGEQHEGSLYELVRAIQRRRFVMIGDGGNRTNFYYIADFIDLLLAVESDPRAAGEVYIASDVPRALRDLVADIKAALGTSRRTPRMPVSVGYTMGACFDALAAVTGRSLPLSVRRVRAMIRDVGYSNGKIARALGIEPRIGLTAGVRRSIAWYRQAGLL